MKRTRVRKSKTINVGDYVSVIRPSGQKFRGEVVELTEDKIELDSGKRYRLANVDVELSERPENGKSVRRRNVSNKKTAAKKGTRKGTRRASGRAADATRTTGRGRGRRKAAATNGENPFQEKLDRLGKLSSALDGLNEARAFIESEDTKNAVKILNGVVASLQ